MKSGKVQIGNAESFTKYADSAIEGINLLYLSVNDLLEEPSDNQSAA